MSDELFIRNLQKCTELHTYATITKKYRKKERRGKLNLDITLHEVTFY